MELEVSSQANNLVYQDLHIRQRAVHDLWALRLRKLAPKLGHASNRDGDTPVYLSGSELEELASEAGSLPKPGRLRADFPRLLETLSLCYFGALLLRLPLSLGDLHR